MTYRKDGTEYLEPDEALVYAAIQKLNREHRTTNNSQVASYSGLNRTRAANAARHLNGRGYIRDVSKGAAYHWRIARPARTEQET